MDTTSINLRLNPDTAEEFKNFCQEKGITQADGFEAALTALELSNAENAVPDEKATIGSIRTNLDGAMNGVMTLLQHLTEAKEKARDDVQAELDAKDQIIKDLTEIRNERDKQIDSLNQSNNDLRQQVEKAQREKEITEARLKTAQGDTAAPLKERITQLEEQVRMLDRFNMLTDEQNQTPVLEQEDGQENA